MVRSGLVVVKAAALVAWHSVGSEAMTSDEERIALFLDYENLAIGARDDLGGMTFDLRPLADALAERGRVVVRRAYADWSYFDADRRMLTEHHVELIEIPQRMGAVRKNAADIKMAVDAVELSFEREYITTFVIAHGRQRLHAAGRQAPRPQPPGDRGRPGGLDLAPAAARLRRVPVLRAPRGRARPGAQARKRPRRPRGQGARPGRRGARARQAARSCPRSPPSAEEVRRPRSRTPPRPRPDLEKLVTQTISGLQRSSGGAVLASTLKRALLRKDPTFSEAEYGFRAFGELLRHLENK